MLSNELAQKIVDSVIPIINCNVNVMNENGIIIGSGNKARIGQIHQIAKDVIESPQFAKEHGVIYSPTIINGVTVQPGVNLPIYFSNKVVGCIGVTGNPNEVLTYAKLLQLTAELLIWKEFSSNKLEFKRMVMSEFVSVVLENKSLSNSIIGELTDMHIEYENFRYCTIVQSTKGYFDDIIGSVDDIAKTLPLAVVGRYESKIVIFTCKRIDFSKSNNFDVHSLRFFTGCKVDKWQELNKSYNVARALSLFKKDSPTSRYSESKLEMSIIMNFLDNPYLYVSDLKKYEKLIQKEALKETYEAYLKYEGVIKDICDNLYIHRNTIIYRLQKIYETTGFDLHIMEDSYRLYSLHIIYQIMTAEQRETLLKEKNKNS